MRRGRLYIGALVVVLLLLAGAWQGVRYWWLHNYSNGSRTGIIRKISVKGSPVCKFLSGEMVLVGAVPGQVPQVFSFTVYDDRPTNPVVKQLHDAERSGKTVTLNYQENRARWWQCADTNYYIVGVE